MMKTLWQRYKKWMIAGAAVLALSLTLVFVLSWTSTPAAVAGQTTEATAERVEAFIGDLSSEATASGELTARREAALTLTAAGTIAEVLVDVGDTAATGDPLVRLDTAALERNVESARQALAAQEANLADLTAAPGAAELAAAEANVASTQAQLDDLLDGPSETELAGAEADVRAAQADLAAASARLSSGTAAADPEAVRAAQIELDLARQAATTAAEQHSTILVTEPNAFISAEDLAEMEFNARARAQQANADLAAAQQAYDDLVNGNPTNVAASQAAVASSAAQRDAAQAQLDLLREGPSATDVAAARSSLAQAQLQLERLQDGPSAVEQTQAEVAVEQARISLQRAERALAEATLVAPFDGVITAVNARVGETAGGVLVQMVDPGSLEVVLEVDEIDIAQVRIGQAAEITLETWPDEPIAAEVAAIAPEASAGGDLITYRVFLDVAETELPMRAGMTANARLVAQELTNVLLLPNQAIQADRTAETYSVNLITTGADGQETIEVTSITIGLRDGRYTQITGGLAEGDVVWIGNALPVETFGPGGDGGDRMMGGGREVAP